MRVRDVLDTGGLVPRITAADCRRPGCSDAFDIGRVWQHRAIALCQPSSSCHPFHDGSPGALIDAGINGTDPAAA